MIIGITGKKFSGKDTCFKILNELYGDRIKFVRYAFGDSLKDEVAYAISSGSSERAFHRKRMDNPDIKEEYRDLIQAFGAFRRRRNSSYWIDKLIGRIESHMFSMNETQIEFIPVITDIRFPNEDEARKLLSKDSLLLKVVRPSNLEEDLDESEVLLEQLVPDYTINNTSTYEDLKVKLKEIFDTVFREKGFI